MERDQWAQTIWQQLQRELRDSLNSGAFSDLLDRLRLTTRLHSLLDPDAAAERIATMFRLRPDEQSAVLWHLTRDEDVTREGISLWGVVNAVTRTAEDVEDYNRATELEELGGQLAQISRHDWDRLARLN